MHAIFLFIYRQPLQRIVLCMVLLPLLWGFLGYRAKNCLRWRLANFAFFVGIVAVIFYMTVYTRGETADEAILIPFHSFQEAKIQPELYRSMLMNVFLFVPIGLSLPFVLGKRKGSILVTTAGALFFSAAIEYMQYRYALGRCEVDDVIMNTLGVLAGSLAYWLFLHMERSIIPALKHIFARIQREVDNPE